MPARQKREVRLVAAVVTVVLAMALVHAAGADAKRKRSPPSAPPPLRIVSVTLTPVPYSPSKGSLDLAVEVELPKELDGVTLLEVSSLISSPSKRSMRFLSTRQPIPAGAAQESSVGSSSPGDAAAEATRVPPTLLVRLSWDGTDQAKQQVTSGKYNYEVRAKLLVVGENGPRTHIVSWPKRGILEIE